MTIRVLLFAQARDIAEQEFIEWEAEEGLRVADIRDGLVRRVPRLGELLRRSMIALDGQYAADSQVVPHGAEIACIPPVSGG
jgi:molybdopterin synthase catalytic subunit/molybdopterin synthase sulfur carrier subunit